MDSLVAKYSRPAYQQDEPLQAFDEQDELMNPTNSLSIKFAMPPVAQVRCSPPP
jgi:20S proteasome subunit beta 5